MLDLVKLYQQAETQLWNQNQIMFLLIYILWAWLEIIGAWPNQNFKAWNNDNVLFIIDE